MPTIIEINKIVKILLFSIKFQLNRILIMTAADHKKYRSLIQNIYAKCGPETFVPENAHDYEDDDCELLRERHAMTAY